MSAHPVRKVSSLEELQQLAELLDIVYYEVSGRRSDGFDQPRDDAEEGLATTALTFSSCNGWRGTACRSERAPWL